MFLFLSMDVKRPYKILEYLVPIDHSVGRFFYRQYKIEFNKTNYSSILEEETDRIALQLLSRACYDIREVQKFIINCQNYLDKQEQNDKLNGKELNDNKINDKCRFIFQHRFNEKEKLDYFKNNLDVFIKFRSTCGCQALK